MQFIDLKNQSRIQLIDLLKQKECVISALRRENQILKDIINMMPGNIFWRNLDGTFLGSNHNTAKILGLLSSKDIIGKHNRELLDVRLADVSEKNDKNFHFQEMSFEEKGFDSYQKPAVYLSKRKALYDNSGTLIGVLGISFDITERKRMEDKLKIAKKKADRANRAKSQFLSIINHELCTPLSSIIGLVSLLKENAIFSKKEEEIIELIDNCTNHLKELVNEILDFNRLEAEEYKIHKSPVLLSHLLTNVFNLTSPLAKQKKLELFFKIVGNIPDQVRTDGKVLRQLLMNLISNGIKFTNCGQVTLTVECLDKFNDRVKLKMTVSDTGIGIPKEKISLIFKPFQQIEDSYTCQSSRRGTGLGLSIVKQFSKLLGMTVTVKSRLGKGSHFSLTGEFLLDQNRKEQEFLTDHFTEKLATPSPQCNQKKHLENLNYLSNPRLKILLVEDDHIVQFLHQQMLNNLGMEVTVVMKGLEAIQIAPQYDLIFVDISLPDIDGFEVIRTIREKYTHMRLKIIALTAYTAKKEKIACLEAGADEFIGKPLSFDRLKQILYDHFRILD